MQNFMFHVPTKVYFGKGEIDKLGNEVKKYGSKVLLVYGGGSIKKIGLYDDIINNFKKYEISYMELSGVDPNPRITSVEAGVKICRENAIEAVVAAGGGSAIDCAKMIAAATRSGSDDLWGIVTGDVPIKEVLPVIAIPTIAAAGSEMDTSAVISNLKTHEKIGPSNPGMRPKVAIMDPTYTFTVSPRQTAAGTADIMSHVLEVYFNNNKGAFLQSRFAEAVLKTCIKYGKLAYSEPDNYEARANLMWAGSWAINGLLAKGAAGGWSCHAMEHELSAHYDIVHGEGLAILIPHWLRHMLCAENVWKYAEYGINVWGIDPNLSQMDIANQAIEATASYFKAMNLPSTLSEVGIETSKFEVMAESAAKRLKNTFVPLNKDDVKVIYQKAL